MIDDLVERARALARQRSGRLAVLRVALPGAADGELVARTLSERLAQAGLPGVEIEIQGQAAAPRILVVEFERWRA